MAKKWILVLFVLAGVAVLPLAAQDFTSPAPQFFTFSAGVPIGYHLEADGIAAGYNFSLGFAVFDKIIIGLDFINNFPTGGVAAADSIRYIGLNFGFAFTPKVGALIGIGNDNNTGANELTIDMGFFANLFQTRSSLGFTTAFKIRVDYIAPTDDFGDGVFFITPGVTFGL